MNQTTTLATLRVSPSWGFGPRSTYLKLMEKNDTYSIFGFSRNGFTRERWKVHVPAKDVEAQIDKLRHATTSVIPSGIFVCDGALYELVIHDGAGGETAMRWWGDDSHGPKSVVGFVSWLLDAGDNPVPRSSPYPVGP